MDTPSFERAALHEAAEGIGARVGTSYYMRHQASGARRLPCMDDIVVRDWTDLNRELYENTWNPHILRFRSDYAYRGMADRNADLTTTLSRLGGHFRELESHLLRNFRKYAQAHAVQNDSEWNWLALAAHHGLPTRMLDWSYSPYIALHFATENMERFDRDAVIWCVNYVKLHQMLPRKLRAILSRERSNAFTAEMLAEAAPNLPALEKLSSDQFAVFFEPPSLDARITNQFALFSFMSSPEGRLDAWLTEHAGGLVRRIILPAAMKWEVRDKLDQANITERVLFPGLDGLSRWLKRHYTPRAQHDAKLGNVGPEDNEDAETGSEKLF